MICINCINLIKRGFKINHSNNTKEILVSEFSCSLDGRKLKPSTREKLVECNKLKKNDRRNLETY